MANKELSLDDAFQVIEDLQKQIEELEAASHEYETELEGVVKKLESQLNEKDAFIACLQQSQKPTVNFKERVTTLEIQVDELESENYALRSKLKALETENDTVIEQNVLLQHELADVRQGVRSSTEKSKANGLVNIPNSSNRICSTHSSRASNALKVSSNQSSLRVSPRNARVDASATHLSSTSVVSTTSYK
ncbi:LAQU0S02e04896g1_1 [Lachancea quebecensis]|uniref:LAQU0S02e04896g1_1 n=1 Tax=Lachancea quebecensis TaxID=1654605 RepID=A0A0P1KQP7_9SACH|nr:LAQU0S02e04896g1_1 [Lachancea quebecensis]